MGLQTVPPSTLLAEVAVDEQHRRVAPPAGAAVAVLPPKISLMIFPKMLIVRSQGLEMVQWVMV